MDPFKGLSESQRKLLRQSAGHLTLPAGHVIFREGDPPHSLFLVLTGRVEIVKRMEAGEVVLATVGPGEFFGEMGILDTIRSADARTSEPSGLLEFTCNPVKLLENMRETDAAILVLRNLYGLLVERLCRKDLPESRRLRGQFHQLPVYAFDSKVALREIERHLPTGWVNRHTRKRVLADGEYLCRQGDAPDGFYYLRDGVLEVLKEEKGRDPRVVNTLESPAIAGDVGLFSGEARTAALRAKGKAECTFFPAKDFEKLRQKSPKDALQLLCAAAQLTVYLIVRKESL
jgi:CRP-like cAMP-binding protein